MSHSREVEGLSQDEPQLLVVAVDVPRGGAGDHDAHEYCDYH